MPDESELHFETAVSQVEKIVESLERGEPDLAAALAKYETGVRLLTQCYGLLERAERSVALLTDVDDQGNPATMPFHAAATIEIELAARSGAASSTAPSADGAPIEPAVTPKPARSRRVKPPEPEPDPFDPPF